MQMITTTEKALPILRIGMFLFMMVWAVEKLVRPEAYQAIFGAFYGQQNVGIAIIYLIGAVQIAILVAFVLGKFKTVTYGFVLGMNLVTTLVSYKQILAPYEGKTNHLFAASIVVLAASVYLFLVRNQDTAITMGSSAHTEAVS